MYNVGDVVKWRLCVGCGACAAACESKNIALRDIVDIGIRPIMVGQRCHECGECIKACPGIGMAHLPPTEKESHLLQLRSDWGSVSDIWEGHATDAAIRYSGSSGGAITAIALYCLEEQLAGGAIHTGRDEDEPLRNKTVISRTRQDLLSRTGSRYSPASPCDCLAEIEALTSPHVFIGKPCDIQAIRKARSVRPELLQKIEVTLGIFCAGTPSTTGLLDLLDSLWVHREDVGEISFRGNGWPGSFSVQTKKGANSSYKLSYSKSWGFLQAYRPFRCYLCPDGTSEFADISCGDPWYREPAANDPGQSLVLVRTRKGREILEGAVRAGYLHVQRVDPGILELSQRNLLMKRRAIWGRLITMKAFGLPVPRYEGFPLFENWRELPMGEKARSIIGTAKRIIQRKYYKHCSLEPDK